MKKRYEIYGTLIFNFCFFIGCIFLLTIFLINEKIVVYKVFNGVIFNEDVLVFVLSDDELKLFNKNKNLFIENKKYKFTIKKIEKDILEREGKVYNQVFVDIDISDMYKVGDVLSISIMEKNIRSYKIFSIIWEGDKY